MAITKAKSYDILRGQHGPWRRGAATLYAMQVKYIAQYPHKPVENLVQDGVNVALHIYNDEKHPKDKKAGVLAGIAAVKAAFPNIVIPDLEVHLLRATDIPAPDSVRGSVQIKNEATHIDKDANNKATIFLTQGVYEGNPAKKPRTAAGRFAITRGNKRWDQVEGQKPLPRGIADYFWEIDFFKKRSKFVAAVTVHELGHLLHQLQNPDAFWALGCDAASFKQVPDLAQDVSPYAKKALTEYVAEVFTARVLGFQVTDQMLADYRDLGGPE